MFHRTLIRRFCASNSVALETNPLLKEATASALASSASSSPSPRLRRKVLMKNIDKKLLVNLNIHDAVTNVKEMATARFDETVDMAINLGVDPRKPNQSVKGMARLPHGTGKKVRIAVFASGADAEAALAAGADVVGSTDLISRIQGGEMGFDRLIATPDMMAMVAKIGKILGPRGLMPNPKMGTVTKDVTRAVKAAKEGAVQFRVDKKGTIHAGIGRVSFSKEMLLENIRAFMVAVSDVKPEGIKGKYLTSAHISSTMGPGMHIDLPTVDPSSPKFMLDNSKLTKLA